MRTGRDLRSLFLAVSTFLLVLVIYIAAEYGTLHEAYELRNYGRPAVGTVMSVQPDNHDLCTYWYRVGDHRYNGSDLCSGQEVGGHVSLTYLPSDPSFSVIGPGPALLGNEEDWILIVSGFAALIVGSWAHRRRTARDGAYLGTPGGR